MGLLAEGFTVLAVLEARDKASEIYDHVMEKVGKFSGTMKEAATSATESGAKIDESFLKTASGADALDLASARVEAAQAKLSVATKGQAEAEKALLEAQEAARAAADGDTEAVKRQAQAFDALTKAQKATEGAAKGLKDAEAAQAATADAIAKKTGAVVEETKKSHDGLSSAAATVGKIGLGLGIAGGLMVKSAADFQSSTTVLMTSGGETAQNIEQVRKGILNLSSQTGTALEPLVNGMYMIGSAGYTGSAGLKVLQAAAQGAKAEGADLGVVSNALTTAMNDYGVSAKQAGANQQVSNAYMNQMIAIVQNGKTTTEDLAGSLSNVLPVAAAAGLSFAQVGGAMATMTGQGMSAAQASQDIAASIRALQAPNAVAVKEMQQMGLNSVELSKNLGKVGLAGTIKEMTDAIQQHMGPAGTVVVSAFQNSAAAAQNAQAMISKMPASLQALAKSYLDGSITAKDWKKDLQSLDPVTAHMMQQFAQAADQTHQFNNMLTSGTPAQQTAAQALTKMMGGATGLNTALMLSANNYQTVISNTKKVADAAKGAGANVDGWGEVQKNFNQKLAQAKQTIEATGITIGTALLPAVTGLATSIGHVLQPIASWVEKHQGLTKEILLTATGVALLVGGINLGVKAFGAIKGAVEAVGTAVKGIGKVFDLFTGSTAASATAADGAAVSMDGLAASEDAAAASTDAATASADASSTSWLATGASALLAAGRFLAMQTAQIAVSVATKAWTAAQWLFNAAMEANPIMLVVTAIAALAAGIYYAYEHFTVFRNIVNAVFDWLKGVVVTVIDFVKDHWKLIVEIITGPFGIIYALVTNYWGQIKQLFADGVHAVETALDWFTSLPGKFAQWLSDVADSVGRGIAKGLVWWIGLPLRILNAISGFFTGLGKTFLGWLTDAASSVGTGVGKVLQWFTDLPGKVVTALGDLSKTLINAGKQLIDGFVNGIENSFDTVKNTLGDLAGKLVDWKGPPAKDKVLLTGNGKLVMQGFLAGIDSQIPAIHAKLGAITATVKSSTTPAAPALPAAAAVGGGTAVHIHLDGAFRGAQIMSDRDMDDLVNKLGGALAKRILPSGGLRVAM